jgi:gliding motility-associated-like protein
MMFLALLFGISYANAEGSLDINNKPGKRLFLYAYDLTVDSKPFIQQLKVYAKAGETINVGASHVGIKGGFIKVYSPKGVLVATFDSETGDGIINNDVEESAGPTGGGTANGLGYKPGVVPVSEEGVYSVYMSYPTHVFSQDWRAFPNLNVGQPWTRALNQPKDIRRVILAWDITVSQNGAGNTAGATLLKGRVYSNELNLIVNENPNSASPTLYVLSREGYLYQVDFIDVDPWGFPITSSNVGLINGQKQPIYKSLPNSNYTRTAKVSDIQGNGNFYYEPQARDTLSFVNNKVFINPPSPDLPARANVTDIFRNDPHNTWLLTPEPTATATLSKFELNSVNSNCGKGVVELANGAYFTFDSSVPGTGILSLDLNNDGDFNDGEDRVIFALINAGTNKIFWDGKTDDGLFVQTSKKFTFNYKFALRSGEIHIMFDDVENNPGGTRITRLNGLNAPANVIYYDHSFFGGTVSGGGTSGNALPTTTLYSYINNFGNERLLDTWSYVDFNINVAQTVTVEVNLNCDDNDGDGSLDAVDIDDDNDGVTDKDEFCNPTKGFSCLPNNVDPGADDDSDYIPNYLDALNNLTQVAAGCVDANNDGKCDQILAIYDTDGDNVPDHYDLDSDNDGITDLDEAGHNKPDVDRNGVIDGAPAAFGINGLYDPLDKDPNSFTAGANYTPWDYDGDGVPDHDDLDSDNDGIYDVREADYGYELSDANNDGRIDVTATNPVDKDGLTKPLVKPIGYPKDFDNDGIPDWHDLDSDNDGINDVEEAGTSKLDPDNDGFVGTGKPVVNKDGVASAVNNPTDTDKDGTPDWHDHDSDNDGIKDVVEAGFPDPDNDGFVGTGNPKVNQWGQPDGFSTSNPPDFDQDGIPDYRDTTCDLALNKPSLSVNGKICPGEEIVLTAQTQYPTSSFIWLNANGDTLAKSGTVFKINDGDPKAVNPFTVMITYKGCKSKISDAVSANVVKIPSGTSFTAVDDTYKVIVDGSLKDSLTKNDNVSNGLVWVAKIVTPPSHGTVTVNANGTFTYKPNTNYDGPDEFTYTLIYDNCPTLFTTAKVTITVYKPGDKDADGIPDILDIDDDNDGVTDLAEFCNLGKGFACLPNAADPSGDDDDDRIANYQDAVDKKTGVISTCVDANNDGICDVILAIYDTDGDNVPDHLDLDSDNDGITDLDEAGHNQPDADRNGVIDGSAAIFGTNGLYNPLDIDDKDFSKGANYTPWDYDSDEVPDHDDLDSDNDGIYDVRETDYGYEASDANNDGRIDVTAANPVDKEGLTTPLSVKPIGYPKDFDGDSYPDWHDLDSDNDGINDVEEGNTTKLDPDNDGFIGTGKPVVNADGVASAVTIPTDTDKDGTPDWHDYDSDNDGLKDVVEADFLDPDNDGQVGTGKPKVNKWGQPDGFFTSNPKDFDKDGIPDYRDISCDLVLNKPTLTSNGKLCPGDEIVLTATSEYTNATQFIWLNSKNDTLAKSGTTYKINSNDPKAVAPFTVFVNWQGCKSQLSNAATIDIIKAPTQFTAVDDAYATQMNNIIKDTLTKNDKLSQTSGWTIKLDAAPINGTVIINKDGTFTYTPKKDFNGTDEFTYIISYDLCANLTTKAKVRIAIAKTDLDDCFIPNVITPNNDGDNDVMFIPCATSYPNNELTVYNRWGAQVHSAKNYNNDWDGSYNGDLLPAGTYYYIYKLNPTDKECKTGYLTIIRN